MRFQFSVDQCIHDKLKRTALVHSRAKSVVRCGIIAVVAIPFYALIYHLLQDDISVCIILINGFLIALALILLKITGFMVVSRILIVTSLYLSLTSLIYLQGGIFSPPGYWLILIPVVSLFIGGKRESIFWAAISICTVGVFYFLQKHSMPLPHTHVSDVLLLEMISICCLLIIVLTLVYFFELGKIEGFQRLENALQLSQKKSMALAETNQELQDLSYKFNAILTAAADGIITTNMHGKILTCNRAIGTIFNYEPDRLIGKNLNVLLKNFPVENLCEDIQKNYKLYLTSGIRPNGNTFPLEMFLSRATIHGESISICIMRDISERLKSEKLLAHLAHYDQLTGLPNRLLFEIQLNNAINKANSKNSKVSLLYFDLDNFKNINNSFGHDVGDLFLKEVADRFKKCVRENDLLARLGGDEFAFILEHKAEDNTFEKVDAVASKLINTLKLPFNIKDYFVISGLSIGIATFPTHGIDVVTLIKNADIAMYQAKANGKNTYQHFDEKLNKHILAQLILETELQTALRKNEFFILYQPQYDILSKKIVGIEALIRWDSSTLGLVKPGVFIPIAEKLGIISALGEWVLKESMSQFKEWLKGNLVEPGTKIAINLSIIQMKHTDFYPKLMEILENAKINPHYVELELTESMFMEERENIQSLLDELIASGITIAIDDFGTGYSSLSRLKNFPVHVLKIDKSFFYGLANSPENASIIKSIIALAHGLGLKVIAEGIETQKQLNFLKENHCDCVQGYYLNPPLDAESMTHILSQSATVIE